jgi:uncharacterized membrane protein
VPSLDVKQRLAGDVALWQADGIIDAETRARLQARYDAPGFGLASAIKYLGIAGGMLAGFGLLGLVAALSGSAGFAAALLAGVGAFLTWGGIRLGRDARARYVHSSRIVLALGVVMWACGAGVAANAAHLDEVVTTFVVGLAVVPLALVLAYRERNGFLLLLATLALFHWVGAWNGMIGRSTYATEIDDPRVMAAVALGVYGLGVWHERFDRLPGFHLVYQATALVYLDLSLLILSIYPSATAGPYIALLTVAALAQIVWGARRKSSLAMGFGVTALGVDLFTRYFERMWSEMGKGLFLVVGGVLLVAFGAAVERSYRAWADR